MKKFFADLISALFSMKPGKPRYLRRLEKKLRGRKNPDGTFFGGVVPTKEKRIERFLAGKGGL